MSDTLEPSSLKRIFLTPLYARRLRHTPLRDLLRFRVTDRLNWRGHIAAAGLPSPIADFVLRVIRRTRLWRLEKAEVAAELIAHFADGLASGATADELVRDFGDERGAAKLIRRAKRRNRSIVWHAKKWLVRACLALVVLYGINVIRFITGRPEVKVDYLTQLNRPNEQLAASDRAWPLYRRALLDLNLLRDVSSNPSPAGKLVSEQTPQRSGWPELVKWVDANQPGIDLLRQASTKPSMGFVFGPGGSAEDPELGWKPNPRQPSDPLDGSLIGIMLPNLNYTRTLAYVLKADFNVAFERGEMPRAERDYAAMLAMARHLDAPIVVNDLVAIGIDQMAFDMLSRALLEHPERFDDGSLTRLAHRTALVGNGGDTASCLFDLTGERMMFHDIMQRLYTDDGHGDGRPTPAAIRSIAVLQANNWNQTRGAAGEAAVVLIGSGIAITNSRLDNEREYDRLLDLTIAGYAKPFREGGDAMDREVDRTLQWARGGPLRWAHYMPITIMMPSLGRAAATGERALATRDGLSTALALELYRRRHAGQYPATLDELVPGSLPRIPVDRVNGQPLRYRVVDGKPVLYSVGVDGHDDGGVMPISHEHAEPYAVALGQTYTPQTKSSDPPTVAGDWLLYGQPLVDAADKLVAESERDESPANTTQPTTEPITPD